MFLCIVVYQTFMKMNIELVKCLLTVPNVNRVHFRIITSSNTEISIYQHSSKNEIFSYF